MIIGVQKLLFQYVSWGYATGLFTMWLYGHTPLTYTIAAFVAFELLLYLYFFVRQSLGGKRRD